MEINPSEASVSLRMEIPSDLMEHVETEESGELEKLSNNPTRRQESCLVFYLKCFFDLGFYVMVIPFRVQLTRNPRTGRQAFQLYTNRFQEIICIIFQAFIVFEFISIIRLIPSWKELNEKRINILYAGNLVGCLIYALVLIYIFWSKKQKFVDILEQLHNRSIFKDPYRVPTFWNSIKVKVFCYGICIVGYAAAMTHPIIHGAFVFPDRIESFFTKMSTQAKACFLMADLQSSSEPDYTDENIFYTLSTIVFTFIHIIMIIPTTVLVHMLNLFALLITTCCWHALQRFLNFCKTNDHDDNKGLEIEDWKSADVLEKYADLKIFIRDINDATGLVFLCCISISLPFYASWTAVLFFEEEIDWFETLHFYVYCTTFLVILTLAANLNKKANEFYDWVSTCKMMERIPNNKMTSLMMDMYANRIALSGCGIFVLTSRFFVTILSIIVTYTSIIVQFQIGRTSSPMRNISQMEGDE